MLNENYFCSVHGQHLITAPVLDDYKLDNKVFGYFVIFRTMLGAVFYHFLQSVALIGVTSSHDRRSILQNGLWPIKFFTLVGCCTFAFYVPLSWYKGVFVVAVIGGCLSTLIQAFLLVDVAYEYAEFLVSRYEESFNQNYKYLLVGSTIAFNVFPLGGSVYLLVKYQDAGDICLVVGNLLSSWLMSFLSTLQSVQDLNPRAGIFQSSLLGCYNFYLIVCALMFRPGAETPSSEPWIKTLSTFSFFAAIFFVAFSAFRTGQASHKLLITSPKSGEAAEAEEEEDEDYSRSFFHFIFLLAALQLALLMNRWRIPVLLEETKRLEIQNSTLSFWISVSTSWVIAVLYIWTLFAPYFFPDREFF